MKPSHRPAFKILLVTALALAIAGCGRRGPLEPHPDAPAEQKARPSGESSTPRPSVGGSNRRTLSSPVTAPKQSIFLDAIL